MPGVVASDVDSGVRVVVTPAQSSYFAGEPFSVTITFTNTRSAEAGPSRTPSLSHKRGSHSISSAPLARPPTSPGTPRLGPVLSTRTRSVQDNGTRKGLIGKKPAPQGGGGGDLPELIEQRRKRQLAKSLSVSISPIELEEQVGEGTLATSPTFTRRQPFVDARQTPTSSSPHVPSPLARTDGLVLSSDHPHARKQSVLDGRFSLDVLSPTTSVPPSPYSPTSSVSTFSLALDPIAESLPSPYPSTPTISFPTIETPTTSIIPSNSNSNSVYAYPPPRASARRQQPQTIGLGHPPNSNRGHLQNPSLQPPRTASSASSTFPQTNAELILYSYAQLTGTLSITPVPGALATQDQTRTLNAVRSALLKRTVVGGGSMDITSSLQQQNSMTTPPSTLTAIGMGMGMGTQKLRQRPAHNRATSFSTGLLSLLSPSSLVASASSPAGLARWRTPTPTSSTSKSTSTSMFTSGTGTGRQGRQGGYGLGLGLPLSGATADADNDDDGDDIDPETPLPTFEVQPAMLAVDLLLLPGESRCYTYTIMLPDNLPPTFRGKSLKFSYELVIGTCRSSANGINATVSGTNNINASASGTININASGANSISRVMKVPIRVYNNVVVGRPPKYYDLVWPVLNRKGGAHNQQGGALPQGTVEEDKKETTGARAVSIPSPSTPSNATFYDVQQYARRLLASSSASSILASSSASSILAPPSSILASSSSSSVTGLEKGKGKGRVTSPLEEDPGHENNASSSGHGSNASNNGHGSNASNNGHGSNATNNGQGNNASSSGHGSNASNNGHGSNASNNGHGSNASNNGHGNNVSKNGEEELRQKEAEQQRKEAELRRKEAEQQRKEAELRRKETELRRREEEEREEEGGLTGCREAVEILTRNPKKASYDVNKDGVKVAVLTFIKSAYRLGETVYGVVELNDRLSRARVLKLSVILEAHESLPSALSPPSSSRHLRRSHAEHHSSFTLNTTRMTFALDIPSDASPAFQVRVGDHVGGTGTAGGTAGGLEWKVRLCLLVAVAAPTSSPGTEGVYMKSLVRDGPRGEWGSSWRAPEYMAPLEKPAPAPKLGVDSGKTTTWAQFFASPFLNGEREYHDGDIETDEEGEEGEGEGEGGYDGIKADLAGGVGVGVDYGGGEEGWRDVRAETVECEVPIKVWAGNTAFKAMDVVFDV